MKAYTVTVGYEYYDGTTTTIETISFQRYANNSSAAISTVSALFGALSNYVYENGTKAITIRQVAANEIES